MSKFEKLNLDGKTSQDNTVEIEKDSDGFSVNSNLFGTLDIEGIGSYYIFLLQKKTSNTWIMTKQDIFDTQDISSVEAILLSKVNGGLMGYGKTYILTRLMSALSTMVYLCVNSNSDKSEWFVNGSYKQESTGSMIEYRAMPGGRRYLELHLVYDGFKLNIEKYGGKVPVKMPNLEPVQDASSKAAVVANLGIKTAAGLFRRMGSRLDWYKSKNYILIDSDEKFKKMMVEFLRDVQRAANANKSVLVGLDTETTGLNMLNLSKDNPLRDNVVSIPFAWKDDIAYVICTDMYYFSNVDSNEVYPLFTRLFSRNPDFSYQDIDFNYEGEHFSFNRVNITVAGFNVIFDEMAFFCEDCDIFFDEDARQLFFNLDTDLIQGEEGQKVWGSYKISNSLKMQTRRCIGDETLELDELFGPKHEDKYRYLQDETLALIYGGADADYTRKTTRIAISMTEPLLYKQYRKYDMPLIYMMAKAAWNGMPIDTEAVRRQGEAVSQDLERIKDFIYHYAWLANRDNLKSKADQLQEILGLDSVVEVEELLEKDKMFRYAFTPANHKKLLFNMLGYPVVKRADKTGEAALDKFVLKKLMTYKRENPVEILTQDIMSVAQPGVALISKDDFNSDAYPLARVFSTYATLNKEYTSYYKPIIESDMEGHMFYNVTFARAATRRILSPAQTMKGSLKGLVVAPPGQMFMSFDVSQMEYRHMASLAYIRSKKILQQTHPDDWEKRLEDSAVAKVHSMMQKPEADYHIETAASMTGKKQHQIDHKTRKQFKSIGFGIPYGLGDRSMCESIFGTPNEENMKKTRDLLNQYKTKQKEIIDLLESTRDEAFRPAPISPELRKYLGVGESHVGIVRNFVGFYRLFILENLTRARVGRIRRQAGNCIIQGGSAELFRRMLYNFHQGCCREGIQDKVHWLMTVHDELDATVDNDIDIMKLIKVLYQECTLRYEDHIPYYIGINFGANWEDAKSDANELPVIMVQRMIDAYDAGKFSIPSDGNQPKNLLKLKRHYMCDRITEELDKLMPGIGTGHEWTEEDAKFIDEHFENYVVRAYLDVFSKSKDLREKLNDWQKARDEYGYHIGFLTEKLEDARIAKEDIDIDVPFDSAEMSLDLFENSSEENFVLEQEGAWFDEGNLFDQNASTEDILVDSEDSRYRFSSADEQEDDFVENPNPKNAHDIFVSKKYIRTKVFNVGDGNCSVITRGTNYYNKELELASMVKKHFVAGAGTIIIVGQNTRKVSGLNLSEEDLDWLDKLLHEQ